MARFTHTVTLDAVPRQWFTQLVQALHDQADGLLTEVEGFSVTSWDPRVESSGHLSLADETMGMAAEFALRSAVAPASFECAGQVRQTSFPRTWSWTSRAELKRWWRIRLAAHCKVAKGEVRLEPTSVDSRQWTIAVTTKVRGKTLAWPFAAVALVATRGKIDRQIAEWLRKAERRWNDEVPALLRRDPGEVVQELAKKWRAADA